jgi:hypothetical protein
VLDELTREFFFGNDLMGFILSTYALVKLFVSYFLNEVYEINVHQKMYFY